MERSNPPAFPLRQCEATPSLTQRFRNRQIQREFANEEHFTTKLFFASLLLNMFKHMLSLRQGEMYNPRNAGIA